jgi:riboflavin transporter FmnP
MNKMNAKTLSFIAIMGALGNILFLISQSILQISPEVRPDFSLIAAFIAAFYGGPIIGFVTGLFVGIFPGIFFGPLGSGAWLGLLGLPIGKALTGLTAGLITKGLRLDEKQHYSLLAIPTVLTAYVPECLFTIAYFAYLMPYFLVKEGAWLLPFVLPKAWAEIIIMSVLMAALVGNIGFNSFVNKFFKNYSSEKK